MREKRDPKDPRNFERQKSGRWGHDKGFAWVSIEELGRRCTRHQPRVVRRVFFGRRVVVLQDSTCKLRAMLRRARKGSEIMPSIRPDVVLPKKPTRYKP